ncbi:Tryptophan halogenase [hydrothermal vent metagenome]|uniref:Tryptophan halogenase n=1 Tax=hydrothermal vent metagenome TaxID=652676 RepID=A0A3B0Z5S3_9ZZZZ
MSERINTVTIVGGGSAGWITALVLTTMLNRVDKNRIKITLIESPRIPNIGVGEGTVTGFSRLLRQLNIDEAEFMMKSDATFKCAGRFKGWHVDSNGKPTTSYNPFMEGGFVDGFQTYYYHQKFGAGGRSLIQTTQPTIELVERGLSPKLIGSKPYDALVPYTYHLNAKAFSDQLASIAKQRGVEYIQDEMLDLEQDEGGHISALKLEERGRYPVQFVVDCTGFRGRILQQALGEPFLDYSKHLLCDRAIPLPVPHRNADHIQPCTTATTLSSGWVFNVPLQSRMGTGYIYSSAHKSDDEALHELKQHLGDIVPDDASPPVIRMNIGRVRNTWVKNCVACGLSAGFVEPLEATAIYTIEQTARNLSFYFPEFGINEKAVAKFNHLMDEQYREVLDFIVMIYYTSNREEPFWKSAREDIQVPDTLLDNLELWKHYLPNANDVTGRYLFNYWDYYFILAGRNYFDREHYPGENMLRKKSWDMVLNRAEPAIADILRQLPSHTDYLKSVRKPRTGKKMLYSVNYKQ